MKAVTAVKKYFLSAIWCLEEIFKNNKYSEMTAKANGPIYQMKNFNFVIALYLLKSILI